jgi:hypothetical protein
MKILLHTCCAPCLIYPLERLKSQGFEVEGFYYNPNIHPLGEYNKRRQAVEVLSGQLQLKVEFPEYKPADFFQAINNQEGAGARCAICWSLRLQKTAQKAREKGFDGFTSTLLVSPYQNQEVLKQLGRQAALAAGVEFYYEDFRPGFKKAQAEARNKGIYCQKYCGCIYSEIERYQEIKK